MKPDRNRYHIISRGSATTPTNTLAVNASSFRIMVTSLMTVPLLQNQALYLRTFAAQCIDQAVSGFLVAASPPLFQMFDQFSAIQVYAEPGGAFSIGVAAGAPVAPQGQLLGARGQVVSVRDIWIEAEWWAPTLAGNVLTPNFQASFFVFNTDAGAAHNAACFHVAAWEVWEKTLRAKTRIAK